MILHIFPYEKFTYDYITKINKMFDKSKHVFWVYGELGSDVIKSVEADNVIFSKNFHSNYKELVNLLINIVKADKVIFHSMFFKQGYFLLLSCLVPFCVKKFFWIIWGADLYNAYWERDLSFKRRIKECCRRYIIRHIPHVGYIPGDYFYLKKKYKTNADFYLASYAYDFFIPQRSEEKKDSEVINILLGNSATRECCYCEMLEQLSQYKNLPIHVFCVLSYPSEDVYRNEVTELGYSLLGEKFEPLVEFLPYEKYISLLNGIDIAIFNHNRQQALGNIASLLHLGKRVYINPQNACKSYFEEMGAIVFSTEDISSQTFVKEDTENMKSNNRKVIEKFFSDEKFADRWRAIFESK